MESIKYRGSEDVQNKYTEWKCIDSTRVELHEKLMPNCTEVTKQNCITKWEYLKNGTKVKHIFEMFSYK